MRKVAILSKSVAEIRRIMIHETDKGTFLYLFKNLEDRLCDFDQWFETLEDAELSAVEDFGVKQDEWVEVDDPKPEMPHDRVT